ncbi:MAG: diguanylate cyclase [Devosia sp.]|uniref:putative bifunctional diguanylate cyclase/phosphodiesterase n=1 Tax=Devosia sp. TaxID=1871048 RepID=UPI0026138A77|nr:EAL domain-containing protein [Devosia sp.]MDB5538566.1 diguanylate cyclase [Devosia sp.]
MPSKTTSSKAATISRRAEISVETLRQVTSAAGISVWTWHEASDQVFHAAASVVRGSDLEQGVPLGATLARIHPDDRTRVRRRLRISAQTGKSGTFRFRRDPAAGPIRHFNATYFPLAPGEVQIIVLDATRAIQAEQALRESEAFGRSILEASTMAIEVLDTEGRLIFMNGPGIEIMEVDSFRAIKGLPFDRFWPAAEKRIVRAAIDAARQGETVRHILFGPTAKGTARWWDISLSPIRDGDGKVARLLALSRDVTEAKHNEVEVESGARRLANVLESTMDSVISVDRDWRITYLNRRAMSVFPEALGPYVGRDVRHLFDVEEAAPFFRHYATAMANQTDIAFEDYLPSAGAWFEIQACGTAEGLIIFFRDVTERRKAQEQIAHLARHDTLTGLPNRMHFLEGMDAALGRLQGDETLAVLSIDLDDFKLVNDTLGHPAGDALLREVAERLNRCAGEHDLMARLGGDEFALLLFVREPEDAAVGAQAILAALAAPFEIEGETVSIGASIGITIAPRDGRTADSLLQYADVALYRVKGDKGRDFRFFEPAMDEALRQRREMKRDLSLALSRGELSVAYQPQIDIGSNRLTGFEALLRWTSRAHGSVSPMVFIPLAEESGLIDTIGAFVLQEACAEAARWPENISLAVNLSPAQFRSHGVVRAVSDALQRTGLKPERLELEITESVLFDESAEGLAALAELHRMGIRVALDDFGTGYSSLSYLRRFPFDKIKIDRSFIADLPGADDSAAIVRAIIGLGRSLKTRVTAEGVETWEQLLMLRAEGCNEAQGYLFSRPLPQSQARALAATGLVAQPSAAQSFRRQG